MAQTRLWAWHIMLGLCPATALSLVRSPLLSLHSVPSRTQGSSSKLESVPLCCRFEKPQLCPGSAESVSGVTRNVGSLPLSRVQTTFPSGPEASLTQPPQRRGGADREGGGDLMSS